MTNLQTQTDGSDLKKLLLNQEFTKIPKVGESAKGIVVSASKNEVRMDIEGFKSGIIRGIELADVKTIYPNLKIGDQIEATVIELENENGEVELSFRFMGEKRGWQELQKLKQENRTTEVKILEANRGGLMATLGHQIIGFIPVSQLSPEHYPRVPGGDKGKILEKLREFIGKNLRVKVMDADEKEQKLIFSEKILWEEEQKEVLSKYKIGDTVSGKVTALADFGAFVAFIPLEKTAASQRRPLPLEADNGLMPSPAQTVREQNSLTGSTTKDSPTPGEDNLEGLVHISEIAWQRLDHPSDALKIGDEITAKIIGLEGSKIFLSIRQLIPDPWQKVKERYQIGQAVKGKVLKVNPFGLFVELDPEIHGLAHISELDIVPNENLEQKIKPGAELEFTIVSIEPEFHRLGLSQKSSKEKGSPLKEEKPEEHPANKPADAEKKEPAPLQEN